MGMKLVFNLIHSDDLLYVHDHVYSPIQISNDITMILQGNQNNNFIRMDLLLVFKHWVKNPKKVTHIFPLMRPSTPLTLKNISCEP